MTLIELMIAIAVFGIGILTVLNLLTQNIALVDKAQIQVLTTMLTKEGMEMVYHKRNTNLLTYSKWDCLRYEDVNSDVCKDSFGSIAKEKKALLLRRDPTTIVYQTLETLTSSFIQQWQATRLSTFLDKRGFMHYLHIFDTKHKHLDTYKLSNIARYTTFEPVVLDDESILYSGVLYKVMVKGLYVQGGNTGEILLESFIGDIDAEF